MPGDNVISFRLKMTLADLLQIWKHWLRATGTWSCCTKFQIRVDSMVDYFSTIGQCRQENFKFIVSLHQCQCLKTKSITTSIVSYMLKDIQQLKSGFLDMPVFPEDIGIWIRDLVKYVSLTPSLYWGPKTNNKIEDN